MPDILKKIYNACNPLRPATAEYYVDCTQVRGSNAMAKQFIRALTLTDNDYKHLLFSGHQGCGKSSELEHLSLKLNNPDNGNKRYFPILMHSEDYLDPYDVTPIDILLAIVAEVASTLRDKAKIELKDSYFKKRLDDIRDFLLTERELKTELSLFGIKAQVARLQKDPESRKQVRDKLLPQMTTVLDEINSVFDAARIELKRLKVDTDEQPYHDFVLIIDDLEKIQRVSGHDEGSSSYKELFIDRAPMLRSLKAHVVYTVPLSLVRAQGANLKTIYGFSPFVLPMIKVERRGTHAPYVAGNLCLRQLLQKRAGDTPLDDIITLDALNWLIKYSGGHVRYFLSFIQQAATYVDASPITMKAARSALKSDINLMAASVRKDWWQKLADLERSPRQTIDNNDLDFRLMLEQNFILEYLNGDEEQQDDDFSADAPWYSVHPIIRELPQYKEALVSIIHG